MDYMAAQMDRQIEGAQHRYDEALKEGEQSVFPVQASEYGGHGTCFGLTILDYFAVQAMNGYLANAWQAKELDDTGDSSGEQMRIVAEISYAMARAMLAARVKP
ncbi:MULTISPECIES: hypothetical protein [Pseudomonas]|uniref:hypothetical protein n=1 Tax=Pseudomonas TaxID=286 RepID=UPI00076126B8|nr:hypothetical protein [Pseudomonas sp. GTC 16482]